MPHAELKYSSDLELEARAILRGVEQVIHTHDSGAGECKGRAFAVDEFHHTHCLLEVSMLPKPHRDGAFTQALLQDLKRELGKHLSRRCFLSLGIRYTDENYITGEHVLD